MIIYTLSDPRDGEVRYVGKTHRDAHRRLRRHLSECYLKAGTHKDRWIKQLLAIDLEPIIEIVEVCSTSLNLCEAERFYISYFKLLGARLTNLTKGGDGAGSAHTPESKAKISAALLGKPKSEQHRINSGLSQRGRRPSEETRAKLSAARKGRYPAPRFGSDNNKTKLSNEAVLEIRLLTGKVSQREIGRRFGVSHTAIRYVQNGRNHLRIREFPKV